MVTTRRRVDPAVLLLMVCGFVLFAIKCTIVRPLLSIGGTDAASHAEMAESLLQGKGFSEDFIQYSHLFSPLRFPEITHPSADYQPLYSSLISFFFLIQGKSAFASKVPAMIIGSILLPALLYWLTARLSGGRFVAFSVAFSALVFPEFFRSSLRCDDDLLFAFLVVSSCYALLMVDQKPKYFYATGILIALAFYAKGIGLLLVPIYLLVFLFRRGWNVFRDKQVMGCFLLAIGLLLPWFIRNTLHFGDPLYSNARIASGYIGYKDWEIETYRLRQAGDRPSVFSKLLDAGAAKVLKKTLQSTAAYISWSSGRVEAKDRRSWNHFYFLFIGVPALSGFLLYGLSYLLRRDSLKLEQTREDRRSNFFIDHVVSEWNPPDVLPLILVNLGLIAFLAVFWEPQKRNALPFLMLNMAVAGKTLFFTYQLFRNSIQVTPEDISDPKGARTPQRTRSWTRTMRPSVTGVLGLIAMFVVSGALILSDYKRREFPFGEGNAPWMEAGEWLKRNAPGSVTMAREPSQLHFYSEQKAIQIPVASVEETIRIMKFYKVTHLIPFASQRYALEQILKGGAGPIRLLYDGEVAIYEMRVE